ncbi:uncharacterized protein LOC119882487 [Micropterus salmoides]|uniref:uncharacterized protein LOC119882487 n=1 Tax=Micropterus salmoides TaxID=27706 RepID=UPI0018ED358D|nr:uncharacterized protein LOC119882487 [Micropterus salmoides]
MSVNDHHQPSPLKKFRLLMCIIAVDTILFLTLLLWIYRSNESFQSWTQYYKATTKPQMTAQPKLPPQCGTGQIVSQGQKGSLVAVKKSKTLLISAYQEHRTTNNEVSEESRAPILPSFTPSGAKTKSCETPSHITVTSAADDSEDILDNEFFEVKNQEANSVIFPYNFTVCLSTMFDFTNVLQLVQSLEMMQLLGVDRVAIYKTSCSPETQHILDYYTHKGLVEVIPWPLSRFLNVSRGWLPQHGPGDLHYFGQIAALNDCVYRYMYQSRYVALQDMDELILPQTVDSWTALLPLLENKYGADLCYLFENNVFPNTIKLPPPTSQTLPQQSPSWQNVPGVNILAHLYQEPPLYGNTKIIVNPRAVFSTSVHELLISQKGCTLVDRNIARMYHTRAAIQTELKPDQLIYDDRLLSYSTRLIQTVNTVLKESGFLQENSRQ